MRTSPTATVNNPANFYVLQSNGATQATSNVTIDAIGNRVARVNATAAAATLSAGNATNFSQAADNATITFDADM